MSQASASGLGHANTPTRRQMEDAHRHTTHTDKAEMISLGDAWRMQSFVDYLGRKSCKRIG